MYKSVIYAKPPEPIIQLPKWEALVFWALSAIRSANLSRHVCLMQAVFLCLMQATLNTLLVNLVLLYILGISLTPCIKKALTIMQWGLWFIFFVIYCCVDIPKPAASECIIAIRAFAHRYVIASSCQIGNYKSIDSVGFRPKNSIPRSVSASDILL